MFFLLKNIEQKTYNTTNKCFAYSFQHRDNVLLLGDSLGDPRMAEGVEHMATVLKIGFLNEKVSTFIAN